MLIGHRGARYEAPENTLAGFKHLLALGIQQIEFDLRLSADNELVVIHDETLDRTTNANGLVREQSSQNLKQLDACSHFFCDSTINKGNQTIEGVPSLKEVLELFNNLQHAQLEVKPPKREDHSIICERIDKALNTPTLRKVCHITSSDIDFLMSCQQQLPDIKRGYVSLNHIQNPINLCTQLDYHLLAIKWQICSESLIQQAKQNNLITSAWTVNDANAFTELQNWGIDSIITDYPSQFIEQAKK